MIRLTDEMKMLDGCIIDCRFFDHQWVFMKQRHDRDHPNGRQAVTGKLSLLHFSSNGDFSFPLMLDGLFFFYFFLGKMEALANQVSRDFLLAHLNIARGLE
jgi:mRNA-capping enzyme